MSLNTAPPVGSPVSAEFPLSMGDILQKPQESNTFVIFGASGDLTRRKLIPALYNLACADLLPSDFHVIGYAVTPMTEDAFRESMKGGVQESHEANPYDARIWHTFAKNLHYITADFEAPEGYETLKTTLAEIEKRNDNPDNRLFYLATPPPFYADIVNKLGEHGLVSPKYKQGEGWTRIIIEKPFGADLESAITLNASIHNVFQEEQIYRIDHYLGKETVQNIMAFRFANAIIEPIWNRRYIDHVQITAAETLGVEHRGGYYEKAGVLRDMFQNHLLQLLTIVAMEPPVRYGSSSTRDRKADVMKAIVPINPENLGEIAVRGQYGPGTVADKQVIGYRQEEGVNPESKTETFAAMKLFVDNWRFAEVPFYLRSGKRMASKVTEISIQFKRVPHLFFHLTQDDQMEPNVLTMRIAPDEGITLKFGAKMPGPGMHLRQVQMNFNYSEAFHVEPATAYETLLLDAMIGDPTLFNRADVVEMAWGVIEPVLDIWAATKPYQPFPNYGSGTWGPSAADALLARDGRAWKNTVSSIPNHAQTTVQAVQTGEPIGARRVRPTGDGAKPSDGESKPAAGGRSLA